MDEDDSPDELINRSASHGKGKRPPVWAISDDSDEAEEQSDEGESDSGEEDEEQEDDEDHLDGGDDDSDDDDDDEEEEEEEEEEDSGKVPGGAAGGTSADLTGLSSDEDSEKCPICLNSFHSQPVATPESCEHYFCLDCILEWSKNANSCPVDRIVFHNIYLRKCYGGKVQKMITVQKPVKEGREEVVVDLELEQTSCEVCGGRDREDRLLLCDGCDAGYHMECLTPPLDAVPVEEWFCPECEANNRRSRGSGEEQSETDSLSNARPTTSRPRPSAAGPTRAIARTQQSERVRANVNRHRITQARTARTEQFTPRFLMQSTWLDETINAVVAGLNTAVYVRDLTPRATSSRRRKTVRRRKATGKRTSSAKGEKGKAAGTGIKRRRRKVRRKKSRRRLVVKKPPSSRGRIAHSLGIAKPKKGTTLPTVCRPSEQTLGSMRADIGAASFSVYGDPFGLDPFDYAEDEEQQVTSLLDAKRRGLSRSALRSHQPVARPITAGLSRQGISLPRSEEMAAPAPVPDLLGSILSGQSMLLMDSSEVVIRRDGSLKALKPVSLPSLSRPDSSRSSSSSGETSAQVTPGMSPVPGPAFSPSGRPSSSSHSSPGPCLSPLTPCSPPPASHSHPAPHLPTHPNRPSPSSGLTQRGINGVGSHRGTTPSSTHSGPDSGSRGREVAPSQSQVKKSAPKPVWVDVAVLPRIPKLKRESGSLANVGTSSPAGGSASNGLPEGAGGHSLAGDRARQHTVDQQQQQQQGQRSQPDRAAPSPAFSSSFSSSTSSSGSPATLLRSSSSSSSSSTVSFRIAGGSSWHSRRLGNTSSVLAGVGPQEAGTSEEEEAKRKRERRIKLLLSDSHNQVKEEEQDAYDPFNPTGSDSNFSDSEAENPSQDCDSQNANAEGKGTELGNEDGSGRQVKAEPVETRISGELDQVSGQHLEVKKEPEPSDTEEGERSVRRGPQNRSKSGASDTRPPLPVSLLPIKKESTESGDENGQNVQPLSSTPSHHKVAPSASCSANSQHSQGKVKIKSEPKDSPAKSKSRSRSPARSSGQGKKASKGGGLSKERRSASSSPEGDRRRGEQPAPGQGSRRREGGGGGGEENRDRRPRCSPSRERRRRATRSSSSSSDSDTSGKYRRKKRRSRSRSKDRRRSRSGSDSSSRERSRRKRQKPGGSKERNDSRGRERDRGRASKDQRRGRSRSRSRSRSRDQTKEPPRPPHPSSSSSKDRAEERPKDRKRARSRSRSRSRERRTEGGASKSSQKTPAGSSAASSSKQPQEPKERKRVKDSAGGSLKEEKCAREKKREVPSGAALKEKAPSRLPEVKAEKDPAEPGSDGRVTSEKPTKAPKVVKEIKQEKISPFDIFEDSPVIKPSEKEPTEAASPCVVKEEQEQHRVKQEQLDPVQEETCALVSHDEGGRKQHVSSAKVKAEPVWTELAEQSSPTAPPFSPATPEHSPGASSPAPQAAIPTDGLGEATSDPPPAPKAPAVSSSLGQQVAPANPVDEALCDSEDEDFNVDMMLDSLDFVQPAGVPAGADQGVAGVKREAEVKVEGAPAGAKSKAPVKRVTWNITEPSEPHSEKSASRLALYKLKLKQEAARRPNSTQPTSKCVPRPVQCPVYLKKLHMQERAVEEVKLAIKPFYRNREITKDEYKDILRKAVQKVCHSKSGEINPVKVANLVKAYVDKYKHARKHKKGEDGQRQQEADRDSDSQ
ncbi:uncharacterized protein phrf1 [Aplochiton taeniatus]